MAQAITKQKTARKPKRRTKRTRRPERLTEDQLARLDRVLCGKLDCVYNDIFDQDDAYTVLFKQAPEIRRPDTSWYHPVMDNLGGENKSDKAVLLTAEEEKALFLQFNFCRYQVMTLADHVDEDDPDVKIAQALLDWQDRAEAYREQIANTNLALVLAMAKRTRMSEVDFSDLISEGNMALLRAVDKFDVARGFKFSTYACRAILKAFSRIGVKTSKYRQLFPTDFDPKLERSDYMDRKRREHEEDCVDEVSRILNDNRAELTEIEHEVITHRFAIDKQEEDNPLTLEQVGKIIGVTKERVRQIQNKALKKIRVSLEETYLD